MESQVLKSVNERIYEISKKLKKPCLCRFFGLSDISSWETIRDSYNDQCWNWWRVSRNPNITWEIIQDNPHIPWTWLGVSSNPNITWEIIQDNPYTPWCWRGISRNQNITWEIIQDNPDMPWDWNEIFGNTNLIKTLWNYTKKQIAALKILNWLKRVAIYDTRFKRAREYAKRITQELYEE